jgi:hypothetical protein
MDISIILPLFSQETSEVKNIIIKKERRKKKMKRKIVGILVCMLVMAIGSASGGTNQSNELSNQEDVAVCMQPVSMQFRQVQTPIVQPTCITSSQSRKPGAVGTDAQVTTFTEADSHPWVEVDNNGNPMVVYDHDTGLGYHEIYLQRSPDGGKTWPADQRYYLFGSENESAINPVIELFDNGKRAEVLFQIEQLNPRYYTINLSDIDDPATWVVWYWEAPDIYPWFGQKAVDVVGDHIIVESQIDHVIWAGNDDNRTFGIFYSPDLDNQNSYAGIYWLLSPDCWYSNPTAAAGTKNIYGAGQYNRPQGGSQVLVAWCPVENLTFENWKSSWITSYGHNFTNPDLTASVQYAYLAIQTDEKGNNDILCYAWTGLIWKKYVVVNSSDDEMYPSITAVGKTVLCTFVKNGNLYSSKSEDGGITWSAPDQINDVVTKVIGEYRCANIEGPSIAWMDNRNGNADLYADVSTIPWITLVECSGGLGCSVEIANVGTGDAMDIEWNMHVQGGVKGLINVMKNGILDIAAGKVATAKSGLFFGLGKIFISATVAGVTIEKEGKHFFIFSMMK